MGIEASYRRIAPVEFECLLLDTAYAEHYFGYDLDTDEEIYAYFDVLEASDRYLDLDKHWQSVYFLYAGEFPPHRENRKDEFFDELILGGRDTPCQATFGFVRYLTADEVRELAERLRQFPRVELEVHLDQLLDPENRENMEPYLLDLCEKVTQFFIDAAEAGDIVLLSFD